MTPWRTRLTALAFVALALLGVVGIAGAVPAQASTASPLAPAQSDDENDDEDDEDEDAGSGSRNRFGSGSDREISEGLADRQAGQQGRGETSDNSTASDSATSRVERSDGNIEVEQCWARADAGDGDDLLTPASSEVDGPPEGVEPRLMPAAESDGGESPDWFVDAVLAGSGDDRSLLDDLTEMLAQSDEATGPAYTCYLIDQSPVPPCAEADGSGSHQFPPDQCWGSYPSHNYDIGYRGEGGGGFDHNLWGWLTQLFFSVGKWSIQVGLWLVGWGLRFDLMFYESFAESVANVYDSELVEGLRLRDAAWLVLVGWIGVTVLRGKLALGGAEFLMTVVLLSVVAVLLNNSAGYMRGASDTMDELSNQVLYAAVEASDDDIAAECGARIGNAWGAGESEGGAIDSSCERSAVFRSMQSDVHEVFVEESYDYINWGQPLSGDCATARDQVLATGPHGSQAWPREHMRQADCDEEAAFNASATPTRAMGGVLTMLVAGAAGAIVAGIATALLVAKTATALLFALAPLAAVGAILPGAGRRVAWGWLSALLQALAVVVGVSIGLSLLLLAVPLTLSSDSSGDLMVRWTLLLVFLLVLLIARRRLMGNLRSGMDRLQDRISSFTPRPVDGPWAARRDPEQRPAALPTAPRDRAGLAAGPAGDARDRELPPPATTGGRARQLGARIQRRTREHLAVLADSKRDGQQAQPAAAMGMGTAGGPTGVAGAAGAGNVGRDPSSPASTAVAAGGWGRHRSGSTNRPQELSTGRSERAQPPRSSAASSQGAAASRGTPSRGAPRTEDGDRARETPRNRGVRPQRPERPAGQEQSQPPRPARDRATRDRATGDRARGGDRPRGGEGRRG